MDYTYTLCACIIIACIIHTIALFHCLAIITLFTMFIFVWQNSCSDHDKCNIYMSKCLQYYYDSCIIMSIAIETPFVVDNNNGITCGCIQFRCTVQKDHENYNLNVLIRLTCLTIGYLVKNINPLLKIGKLSSFRVFSGIFHFKNIKNHGFNGLTLKTEVFIAIFQLDLVSEMSTKSCARTLKNTCISSIEHPQKTALKNTFFECDNQNFFKIIVAYPLYFVTSTQTPFLINSFYHSTSLQKTMYFSRQAAQAQPMIMVNLT